MAALRADTIATITQRTGASEWRLLPASSAPVSANGNANTEWLKRMNDKYVASRLSSTVQGFKGSSLTERLTIPLKQILFDVVDCTGQFDRDDFGALSGVNEPSSSTKAERARTDQRRALEDLRRRHSGASHRIVFSSENRLRSSTLARLSVPTATSTPDR